MAKSDAGYAKNVANMDILIGSCVANTERYKPSNKNLEIVALKLLHDTCDKAVTDVNTVFPAHSKAIGARDIVFYPVSKLVTRIYGAVRSCGASKQVIANFVTIKRKLQGTRATAKLTVEEKAAAKAAGVEKKDGSASQRSFDQIVNNFDAMIKLLDIIPEYKPNEADLKVTALKTTFADLVSTNKAVIDTSNPLYKARTDRNAALDTPDTGLVDICLATKAYIKSVDGSGGRWYKQISGLKFTRVKD